MRNLFGESHSLTSQPLNRRWAGMQVREVILDTLPCDEAVSLAKGLTLIVLTLTTRTLDRAVAVGSGPFVRVASGYEVFWRRRFGSGLKLPLFLGGCKAVKSSSFTIHYMTRGSMFSFTATFPPVVGLFFGGWLRP